MAFKITFDTDTERNQVVYATSLEINSQDQLVLDGGRTILPQSMVSKIELD